MIRVGLAQIDIKIGDREKNYETIEAWMARYYTKSELETVVVLPEFFDVGYAIEEAEKYADKDARQAVEFLGKLAKKYNVWFAGGSVLCKTEGGFVNRCLVINPKSEYVNHYDKVHLIPLMEENLYIKAGERECIFEIQDLKGSCLICYDIRFCEWMRLIAVRGAQVFFISAEWPTIRIDHWIALLKARAIENMMYIVACNRVGNSKSTEFGGHSLVIDPWGNVLYEGSDSPEGAFIEIDSNKVSEIREHLKVFEVRRPQLYTE